MMAMGNYEEQNEKILGKMEKIRWKIAVASGKGGVGKSVVSALISSELARKGSKVGILDADITGASIPRIFGIKERPGVMGDGLVPPKSALGVRIMSINLLLEEENSPVIWRGPLIGSVIRQFLSEAEWGDLDYLIIDLPPGTGDSPLTVMQSLPLDGIVVVSSPQDLVAMIVEKAISMANSMKVPIIGLVENMGWLSCPHCRGRIEPFGKTSAEAVAAKNKISLLGKLPIDPEIAELCDNGKIEEYESRDAESIVGKIDARLRGK